jgi:hypothetical protein
MGARHDYRRCAVSSKATYVVAGSLIGGAVGYFFLTESGRKAMRSVRDFDPKTIPHKLEDLRGAIERRGQDINRRVETARHRVLDSFEAGRKAYVSADTRMESQLRRVESINNEVVGGIHRAVDELGKTVYAFEKSILSPVYETISLVEAVKQGVHALKEGASPRPLQPMTETPRATGFR